MYSQKTFKQDFFKLFVPILATFLFSFLLNLVDLYFASKINVSAIAALQAVFPIMFLFIAFNEGFNIATNNLLSKALWEWNKDKLNIVFLEASLLAVFIGIIFFLFSPYIANFFLWFQNLTPQVYQLSFDYINIIIKYSFLYFFLGIVFASLIVFKKDKWQIILWIIALLSNIILNYILVIKYNLWTYGLAIATVITMFLWCLYFLIKYLFIEKIYDIKLTYFLKIKEFIKEYLVYFLWAFFSLAIFIVEFFVNNYFSSLFGTKALASYALVSRLFNLFQYPFIAITIVFSTMFWFWLWKKDLSMQKNMIQKFTKISFIYSLAVLFVVFFIFKYIVLFFTSDQNVIQYSFDLLVIFALFLIVFVPLYLFGQLFQVAWFHKTRVVLNILTVVFIVLFEYGFYIIFHSFYWVWLGWLLGQLLAGLIVFFIYKFYVKKKLDL